MSTHPGVVSLVYRLYLTPLADHIRPLFLIDHDDGSPAKSLPMQAIMLYMSGSGIQIFSMGIVWTLLTSPFNACSQILKSRS